MHAGGRRLQREPRLSYGNHGEVAPALSDMAGDVIRYPFLAAASMLVVGCATPYAKVDGILVDTRPAPAAEPARVTVIHKGKPRPAAVQQSIVSGDRVVTR